MGASLPPTPAARQAALAGRAGISFNFWPTTSRQYQSEESFLRPYFKFDRALFKGSCRARGAFILEWVRESLGWADT